MSDEFAALDAIFETFAQDAHVPGLVAGVVRNGELAWLKTSGVADLSTGESVRADTRFRIASMTKNVTALILLHLRDKGLVELEAPVSRYVPALARSILPTVDSRPPTVRDLLNHTAGLVNDDPWADRELAISRADFDRLLQAGSLFAQPPGLAFEYSNLGYALLGRIAGEVSGRRYQDLAEELLFAPLGMTRTGFDPHAASIACGYRWTGADWEAQPIAGDGEFAAMGGLVTTAEDYARYVAFLLDAWPARDDVDAGPVRRSTVRDLALAHGPSLPARPPPDGEPAAATSTAYGYGLLNTVDPELGRYLHHAGGLPGFGSFLMISPETGTGLFCFSNLTYASPDRPVLAAARALRATGLWETRAVPTSAALQAALDAVVAAYNASRIEDLSALAATNLWLDEPILERNAALRALRGRLGASTRAEFFPRHALAGRFRLICERGEAAGELLLTPGPSPRIQKLRFD